MRPRKGELTCREAVEELRQMEQTPAIVAAIKCMESQLRQLDREKKTNHEKYLQRKKALFYEKNS